MWRKILIEKESTLRRHVRTSLVCGPPVNEIMGTFWSAYKYCSVHYLSIISLAISHFIPNPGANTFSVEDYACPQLPLFWLDFSPFVQEITFCDRPINTLSPKFPLECFFIIFKGFKFNFFTVKLESRRNFSKHCPTKSRC